MIDKNREYTVSPIGWIEADVREPESGQVQDLRQRRARIIIFEEYADALVNATDRIGTAGSEDSTQANATDPADTDDNIETPPGLLDVVFLLDRVDEDEIELKGMSSAGLTSAGERGVFTSRTPRRPNRLGTTTVRLLDIDDRLLEVEGLDAVDSTPVLDIKPHVDWTSKLGISTE